MGIAAGETGYRRGAVRTVLLSSLLALAALAPRAGRRGRARTRG